MSDPVFTPEAYIDWIMLLVRNYGAAMLGVDPAAQVVAFKKVRAAIEQLVKDAKP